MRSLVARVNPRRLPPIVLAMAAGALLLCAPAAVADAADTAATWWDRAWVHRQRVEVVSPDPSGTINTAEVDIDTGGEAQSDGADLRIIDGNGHQVRFAITKADGGVFHLEFEVANPAETDYAVYYGNPEATPATATWTKKLGGLRLTTRTNRGGQNGWSLDSMRALIAANSKVYGSREWPLIDDATNPFGPEEHYLSIYEGTLFCPTTGVYMFITNSDDASFLLIDKEDRAVAQFPGGHNPDPTWDESDSPESRRKRGRLKLAQGIHRITYYHVQSGGGALARAGWKRPGDRRFTTIGAEYFLRRLRAEVRSRESLGKLLNAFFTWDEAEALQFGPRADCTEYHVKFHQRAAGALGEAALCTWDFGDGSPPSREADPVHTYLTPGPYTVALECRDRYGSADAIRRRVKLSGRDAERIDVFMEAEEESAVLMPGDPVQVTMRFKTTWSVPLDAVLHVEVTGAEGKVIYVRQKPLQLTDRDWTTEGLFYRLPRDEGVIRVWLERAGLTIGATTVRVVYARNASGGLMPEHTGLVNRDGERTLLRIAGGALAGADGALEVLKQTGKLKVLVVDDYLSPSLGGDGTPTYYQLFKDRLLAEAPDADIDIDRIGRDERAQYPPMARLAAAPDAAKADGADLVLVAGGIEDILHYTPEERYERLLWALVERLQGAAPTAEIVLLTPPPFVSNPALSGGYARAVKRVALRTGVGVADVYSAFMLLGDKWKDLYRDAGKDSDPVYYLSPRSEGQAIIAGRVFERISGEEKWTQPRTADK